MAVKCGGRSSRVHVHTHTHSLDLDVIVIGFSEITAKQGKEYIV